MKRLPRKSYTIITLTNLLSFVVKLHETSNSATSEDGTSPTPCSLRIDSITDFESLTTEEEVLSEATGSFRAPATPFKFFTTKTEEKEGKSAATNCLWISLIGHDQSFCMTSPRLLMLLRQPEFSTSLSNSRRSSAGFFQVENRCRFVKPIVYVVTLPPQMKTTDL